MGQAIYQDVGQAQETVAISKTVVVLTRRLERLQRKVWRLERERNKLRARVRLLEDWSEMQNLPY